MYITALTSRVVITRHYYDTSTDLAPKQRVYIPPHLLHRSSHDIICLLYTVTLYLVPCTSLARTVIYTKLCTKFYKKFFTKFRTKLFTKLCTKLYTKLLHKALHEALHKALHKALRTKALHEALREALRTEALHEAPYRVPAIFPIASTRASAKYTPHIATLFFTHPSFLTSSLPRKALERQPAEYCRQNQTATVRTTVQRTPRTIQSIELGGAFDRADLSPKLQTGRHRQ